jgi:hypothetical protein
MLAKYFKKTPKRERPYLFLDHIRGSGEPDNAK